MKKIFFIIILLFATGEIFSQQEAMFTHYMYNTLAVNPAYAGSREKITLNLLHRSQWIGFSGAPLTQTLTVHSPITKKNLGIGFSAFNDRIGRINTSSLSFDISYRIKINRKSNLRFGLKTGFLMKNLNFLNMNLENANDPDFAATATNGWLLNFGAGVYYYSDVFFAGVSVPKILQNGNGILSSNTGSVFYGDKRHFYAIGGYLFKLDRKWRLKTYGLVKFTSAAPMQVDLTGQFIYKNKFWIGGMTRLGDAVGILAGFYLSKNLLLGYSFDLSYSNTTFRYNAGSHEIMLQYSFELFPDHLCPAYDI